MIKKGKQYLINPKPLTAEGFAPYGEAVLLPTPPAPKQGEDWDCWIDYGSLSPGPNALGIIVTRPTEAPITTMEAHTERELLIPITGPVIQAVAALKVMHPGGHAGAPTSNEVIDFLVERDVEPPGRRGQPM